MMHRSIPRTKDEIIERIKIRQPNDFFGFEYTEYFRALYKWELEELKEPGIIKQDADLKDWEPDLVTITQVRDCCIDYMEFAWGKANNFRGISANRSIQHYIAWLWLIGGDKFDNLMDDYRFYGKPQLVRICNYLDIDSDQWDNGVRKNSEY